MDRLEEIRQRAEAGGTIRRIDVKWLLSEVDALTARAEKAGHERDAAVKDMTEMAKCRLLGTCTFCKHRNTPDARYKPCKGCEQPNGSRKNFEWRGKEAGEEKNDEI